jgi:hypothetical protein
VEDDKPSSVYTNVVDIWSFGCVIYKVVAKQVPFPNGREIKKYCENRIPFPAQSLEGKLTTNGIDFLQSILVAKPLARPTADIAIQHSWLLSSDESVDSQLQQRAESLDEKALSASIEASTANRVSAAYCPKHQERPGFMKGETQQGPENPINQPTKVIEIKREGLPRPERYRRRIIRKEREVNSSSESERYRTRIAAKRVSPLPAPTETETDLVTDFSRVTDKKSPTLPEDCSPVTIPGKKKKHDRDGESLTRTKNESQASLLREYIEDWMGSQADPRPNVRVKVTPSSKSRSRSTNKHSKVTESKGTHKLSRTKRINLSSKDKNIETESDNKSVSSFASAAEELNVSRSPIDIEIMPKRYGSLLIPPAEGRSRDVRIQELDSDVSSMPADSFLDGWTRSPERKRSQSLTRGEAIAAGAATGLAAGAIANTLHTPSRRHSRSLSRERIVAQKGAEKVKADKSDRRRKHNSGSQSRQVDGSRLSADQRSFSSGTSKSSIDNPKLLQTVEDAIRLLILPELTALKKEQKISANREKFERERRGSITSGSTRVSRDSRDADIELHLG